MGTLLFKELRKRGHEVEHFYSGNTVTSENPAGWNMNGANMSLWRKLVRRMQIKRLARFDIGLHLGNYSEIGLKYRYRIDWWQGIDAADYRDFGKYGFACSPDMYEQKWVPVDMPFLPRCVDLEMFHCLKWDKLTLGDGFRIGHLWRRGWIAYDYCTRYFKDTDLLEEALKCLRRRNIRYEYVDKLWPRNEMARAFESFDVFAAQFRMGAYGMNEIESLIVGTPVVGYYKRELCECAEAFEMMLPVNRRGSRYDPYNVADCLREAKDMIIGSTRGIEAFHSVRHTADELEDQLAKWRIE